LKVTHKSQLTESLPAEKTPRLKKPGKTSFFFKTRNGSGRAMSRKMNKNNRKSAGSVLFSIFLASIVPHASVQIPNF
jgi:hypothetical protein